jgi:alkylation response protein AidB-like acyl-CoA dehydrogenase
VTLAVTEEHQALAEVAAGFLADHGALGAARRSLAHPGELPPFWDGLCALGWPGIHLPEELGGQGYGLPELAVVLEAMGRVVAPGPFLPTVWASAVLAAAGGPPAVVRRMAAGEANGAVGTGGSLTLSPDRTVAGDGGLVLGAGWAAVLVLPVGDDAVVLDAGDRGVTVAVCESLDPTRPLARVTCAGAVPLAVLPGAAPLALSIGRVLAAAEAAGGAAACTEMAVRYAREREQFGRPIGSFQAVKHHCADMLVDSELAAAVAWDAARAAGRADRGADPVRLVAAIAATCALPAFRRCAERNVQVHGGIGYTWEHDAHLYLRRAATLAALFGAEEDAAESVTALTLAGVRPALAVDLPPEAERYREEVRAFRRRYEALPPSQRRAALIDAGYLVPHWPPPWGRGAGAVEQMVIEQELAGVAQAGLGIGAWVLATIIQHGTPAQLERWVRPTLEGRIHWCQLFSEPNAGSDAAAIQTRAVRVEGGWVVNGQKVWTSGAQSADWGLATVRTDPDAPKHAGITTMAIDMHAPGVEVRPLREMTGETLFNEVFLTDVFVSDADVVGEVNNGWAVARATLGNERVSIGASAGGMGTLTAYDLADLLARYRSGHDREVGAAVAEAHALAALNLRRVARAVAGGGPGTEGNVSKLVAAEHAQRVARLAMRIAGADALVGEAGRVGRDYLYSRCLTIGGGTSEIIRNVIAERILGLPRDPLQR